MEGLPAEALVRGRQHCAEKNPLDVARRNARLGKRGHQAACVEGVDSHAWPGHVVAGGSGPCNGAHLTPLVPPAINAGRSV